jgi:hypothetical protein
MRIPIPESSIDTNTPPDSSTREVTYRTRVELPCVASIAFLTRFQNDLKQLDPVASNLRKPFAQFKSLRKGL